MPLYMCYVLGGALQVERGALSLIDSSIRESRSRYGGGLFVGHRATSVEVLSSNFSENEADVRCFVCGITMFLRSRPLKYEIH